MAVDVIGNVRAAEAQAEDIVRKAAMDAGQIVDQAHTEAIRLENQAADDARAAAAGQLAAAHEQSRQALETAMGELDREMEQLAARARANQSQAVRLVLELLV